MKLYERIKLEMFLKFFIYFLFIKKKYILNFNIKDKINVV